MPDKIGDKARLQHIVDSIDTIDQYISDVGYEVFAGNQMMQDACLRQIQVIGEACRNLSSELREKYPKVPWRQIVGLRIIVIHEYFGVDQKVVWEIIRHDLPVFRSQVKTILDDLE